MSELKRCGNPGCCPVLQTRGEMKPEDHHKQYARYLAVESLVKNHGVYVLDLSEYRKDAYDVENESEHRYDVRVSCALCGEAIGWQRRDIEEFKRHGDGDNRRHVVTRDGNIPNVIAAWNNR